MSFQTCFWEFLFVHWCIHAHHMWLLIPIITPRRSYHILVNVISNIFLDSTIEIPFGNRIRIVFGSGEVLLRCSVIGSSTSRFPYTHTHAFSLPYFFLHETETSLMVISSHFVYNSCCYCCFWFYIVNGELLYPIVYMQLLSTDLWLNSKFGIIPTIYFFSFDIYTHTHTTYVEWNSINYFQLLILNVYNVCWMVGIVCDTMKVPPYSSNNDFFYFFLSSHQFESIQIEI